MLGESERAAIATAVAAAETATAAEIVPVLARASGRYDRAEDLCGLWLAVVTGIGGWNLLPPVVAGSWDGGTRWAPWLLLGAVLLAFILGALIAGRWFALRRLFIPRAQEADEVLQRARSTFADHRLHHRPGVASVMIYLSLAEHRAVLLGDRTITEQVGDERLQAWCTSLTTALRRDGPVPALTAFIAELGQELAAILPGSDDRAREGHPDMVIGLPAP